MSSVLLTSRVSRSQSQANLTLGKSILSSRYQQQTITKLNHKNDVLFDRPDLYRLFNEFELVQSRYAALPQFKFLINEIKSFNNQLRAWKQQNIKISNLRSTYYFYQNLNSRIRHVNNLCMNQQSAIKSLLMTIQWFQSQKPKIRGQRPKNPQAKMRQFSETKYERQFLQDLTSDSIRKRELKPYETMARTAHTNFFPPKQRLLDYHRKQFVMNPKLTIDSDQMKEKRFALSASGQSQQIFGKRASLLTTMTTLKPTTMTNFRTKNDTKQLSITGLLGSARDTVKQQHHQQQFDDININQFNIDMVQHNKENQQFQQNKLLDQQDKLNDLIQQPKFEQDEADQVQQDLLSEENKKKSKYKKVYQNDHHNQQADQVQKAKQKVKDAKQSTLRRLLEIKENQIKRKLEDLNIRENIKKWAKTKTFINEQINRKSQSYKKMNNFHRTEYNKKGFFEKRRDISEFDFKKIRNRTTQQIITIEQSVEKKKVNEAMKMFGRYISSHVNLQGYQKPKNPQNQENQSEIKLMRATSLTAFNRKQKKKQFGQVFAHNNLDAYNNEVAQDVIYLKQKLSKKMIPVNNNKVYSALSVVKTERTTQTQRINVYPKAMSLLSNPFFPKHLYQAKKKKKK